MFPRPFGMNPFQMMDEMFSNDPFFNPGLAGGRTEAPPRSTHHHASTPIIEEVVDDEHTHHHMHHTGQPHIEEPNDDPHAPSRTRRRESAARIPEEPSAQRARTYPHSSLLPFGGGLGGGLGGGGGLLDGMMGDLFGGHSMMRHMEHMMDGMIGGGGMMPPPPSAGGGGYGYSYRSTTISGPNGPTFARTMTTHMGPGGVREDRETVRDGRVGKESVSVHRALGDGRARVLVRERDASGREEVRENVHNMRGDDVAAFDREWMDAAQRLGGGGGGGGGGGVRGALPPPRTRY